MTVIETKLATTIPRTESLPIWVRVLRKILPLANPDFDDIYSHVRNWWVEIDGDGTPQRELGFNVENKPIVAGPLGTNFGFWTDSTMKFVPDEHTLVAQREFDSVWSIFEDQWKNQGTRKNSGR